MGLLDFILSSLDDKGCDWYCDECDAYLNKQDGFTTASDEWECTECGYINDVSEYNIVEDDDDDESEGLSVYEAAEIWASHGKDEDYMFGYDEDELEDAL